MLKWVVTRGPQSAYNDGQTSADEIWDCNKENHHPHKLFNVANNNNNACYPNQQTPCKSPPAINPRITRVGSKSASKMELLDSIVSPSCHSNSTLSSFRHFVVNDHSSPLKRLHYPKSCSISSLYAATPNTPHGNGCTTPRFAPPGHRAKRQRPRRRISSLHIREPTELASPSYRPADDPANDLLNDLLLSTTPSRTPESPPQEERPWRQLLDMLPVDTAVHYNEREIKTPEAEKHGNVGQQQLVRRKAVRRKRYVRTNERQPLAECKQQTANSYA